MSTELDIDHIEHLGSGIDIEIKFPCLRTARNGISITPEKVEWMIKRPVDCEEHIVFHTETGDQYIVNLNSFVDVIERVME